MAIVEKESNLQCIQQCIVTVQVSIFQTTNCKTNAGRCTRKHILFTHRSDSYVARGTVGVEAY